MLRRILPFVLSLLLVSFGQAQKAGDESRTPNLYEMAVSACVSRQLSEYGREGPATHSRLLNRKFLKTELITENLPTAFGDVTVEFVDADALAASYEKQKAHRGKAERKEIPVTVIQPMRNEDTTLIISLVDYWFSYEKKSYTYALEGGCKAYFTFDANGGHLTLTKTDLWGI